MATVILSDDTVRSLVEAHASLSAWYYQMAEALRTAGISIEPPSQEQRLRFVEQMASHFPEVAGVARTIQAPRPYVPPPVIATPSQLVENEGVVVKPAPLIGGSVEPTPPDALQVPERVDPNKVKYE